MKHYEPSLYIVDPLLDNYFSEVLAARRHLIGKRARGMDEGSLHSSYHHPRTYRTHLQDEEDCFPGTIAGDNGDATYAVHFDDGDVLEAAPRGDIQVLSEFDRTNHEEVKPEDFCIRHESIKRSITMFLSSRLHHVCSILAWTMPLGLWAMSILYLHVSAVGPSAG